MKYEIEQFIPLAMFEIENFSKNNYPIPKEFNGYISSFGISVLQNGMIPTLAIYSNTSNTERPIVLEWMYKILNPTPNTFNNLFEFVLSKKDSAIELEQIEKKLLDISIALKLCIRTFETTKF